MNSAESDTGTGCIAVIIVLQTKSVSTNRHKSFIILNHIRSALPKTCWACRQSPSTIEPTHHPHARDAHSPTRVDAPPSPPTHRTTKSRAVLSANRGMRRSIQRQIPLQIHRPVLSAMPMPPPRPTTAFGLRFLARHASLPPRAAPNYKRLQTKTRDVPRPTNKSEQGEHPTRVRTRPPCAPVRRRAATAAPCRCSAPPPYNPPSALPSFQANFHRQRPLPFHRRASFSPSARSPQPNTAVLPPGARAESPGRRAAHTATAAHPSGTIPPPARPTPH